jgi:hypothetical protein
VRGVHIDLSRPLDREFGTRADGADHERQPWTPDRPRQPEAATDIERTLAEDDADSTRIESVKPLVRAHAINEGDLHRNPTQDLLPEF